ncbi:hypothetical protein [Dokdonella sp.]|uniref:hypothetical protein n=1 Tax=Dokdonella sp. TaxID=2291710 RepID=UPI001B013C20|nr:hypothetical protein [Dokdonella sp.]MBO9661635.1 hypothetical protein [Dokdonella sp.]
MLRWILLVLALLGLALAFIAKSPGLLGIGLLLGFIGTIGFVLGLAADRIAENARPDTAMASVEELVALRKPRGAAPDSRAAPTRAPAGRDDDAS